MSDFPTAKGIDAGTMAALSQGDAAVQKAKSLSHRTDASVKEIDKAASGFEALLLHEMLQAMWETVEPAGLLGEDSNQAQIYRDMLNQAIADSVASGHGVGIKETVKNEILRREKASKE